MIDRSNPDYGNTPASATRPTFSYSPAGLNTVPCVTIATPFYNERPAIFDETARTVFQQSFQQWEWIIVNDASTDPEALSTLTGYRSIDPRVRVIDQDVNQGLSAARNLACRMAATDYVVLLDSDNLLEPTAVEKWLWYLQAYPEFGFVKGFTVGFGAQTYLWNRSFDEGDRFLITNQVDATSLIRREVHQAAGGFDESNRDGFEDWDFWLRCANAGSWGGAVPEFFDWYRRRDSHADRWKNWDSGERQRQFRSDLRRRYPRLWDGGFPHIPAYYHMPNAPVPDTLPCANLLAKTTPRILIIVPWLEMGGADKFTLDLVKQLRARGWEITIATTLKGNDPWDAEFGRHTPDIFMLHRFIRVVDYPRFLRYLIQSRQVDAVLVTHSELGYQLLPYLRAHCPDVPFLDYCHIDEHWKNGGYPRMSVEAQEQLELDVVSSEHLKQWMVTRGADADRIQVCYTGVDADEWCPSDSTRTNVRRELGLVNGTCVILYAARICPQKQPRVFASTLLRLHRAGTPFVALVAGDGPDLGQLKHLVRSQGLGRNVKFLGAVSNQRVNELMKASDVFFLPSEWEGIALSIFEAMASGLAIVGADVGGQRELVTADCGFLVPRGREDEEADKYAHVLTDLIRDPAKLRQMGQAGRARVRACFRLDQMGHGMVEHILRAIEWHDRKPRPVPSIGLGRSCATQAVEYVRMSMVAETLWQARTGILDALGRRNGLGWRARIYAICRRLYEPLYRRGASRGGAWYFSVAERLKSVLLKSN